MLHHLKAYARPAKDGDGVDFDIEAIAVDLITLAKAANVTEEEFFSNMRQIWCDVSVTTSIVVPPGEEIH